MSDLLERLTRNGATAEEVAAAEMLRTKSAECAREKKSREHWIKQHELREAEIESLTAENARKDRFIDRLMACIASFDLIAWKQWVRERTKEAPASTLPDTECSVCGIRTRDCADKECPHATV